MKERKTANVLDECIDSLGKGQSVDECISTASDFSEDLLPVVRTAHLLLSAKKLPNEVFISASKARLTARIKNEQKQPVTKRFSFRFTIQKRSDDWSQRPRRLSMPGFVAALALALSLIGSGGLVYASQDALPGQALFNVKRIAEAVRVNTASGDTKQEMSWIFAEERIKEMAILAEQGNTQALIVASELYCRQLKELSENANNQSDTVVAEKIANNSSILKQLQEKVSGSGAAEQALHKALTETEHFQDRLRQREQDRNHIKETPQLELTSTAQVPIRTPLHTATPMRDQDRVRDRTQDRGQITVTATANNEITVVPVPSNTPQGIQEREQNREKEQANSPQIQITATPVPTVLPTNNIMPTPQQQEQEQNRNQVATPEATIEPEQEHNRNEQNQPESAPTSNAAQNEQQNNQQPGKR